MQNIRNFNFNKLDVILSNSDYWDFFLGVDESPLVGPPDCTVTYIDFNNSGIFYTGATSANTISSLVSWTGATNTGYTFSTIGLTGIDNGLVTFEKLSGDTSNQALLSALTGTTLVIPSGDTRMHFTRVTGTTGNYIYPIDIVPSISGNAGTYAQFCGGFYQGYYKIDGSTYQVLPTRVHEAWTAQFWLKRDSGPCSGNTGTTLNDTYPENSGIFFYMGTRAENKFWNRFEGADTGCTSGCTQPTGCTDTVSEWCTIPKETQVYINAANGFGGTGATAHTISLSPDSVTTNYITNPFLIYGRANSGATRCGSCGAPSGFGNQTACSYDGTPIIQTIPKTVVTDHRNPFLVYGRANSGATRCGSCGAPSGFGNETACSFSGFSKSVEFDNLDYNLDVIDNAIGFRIREDGSIGYRLLTVTGMCSGDTFVSGVTVEESYSLSGMVTGNCWSNIVIRFKTNYLDDCGLEVQPKRKGTLYIYVNGKLKFVKHDFDEFIARRLEEHWQKQVAVPFNFSLGGGSQGLIETQTFDGRDQADLGLPIEKNFAGSFVGAISQFKFNICDLSFTDIENIYYSELPRYDCKGLPDNNFILASDNSVILSEDGFGIIWTP
jgi:hypothetical protein